MRNMILVLASLFALSANAHEICGFEVDPNEIFHRGTRFGTYGSESELRLKAGASKVVLCQPNSTVVYLISLFPVIGDETKSVTTVESFAAIR